MIISLIVAVDELGGIGKDNQLPWHISSDLKRFKALTMGHFIAVGRKTYQAIGRLLPGRVMIILSRNPEFHQEGCLVVSSIEDAITLARDNQETELFIIGGGEVFEESISIADKIYLTTVHARVNADVVFPEFDPASWIQTHFEEVPLSETDEFRSDYRIFVRKGEKQG